MIDINISDRHIRNIHAVSTNQIADIVHFNNKRNLHILIGLACYIILEIERKKEQPSPEIFFKYLTNTNTVIFTTEPKFKKLNGRQKRMMVFILKYHRLLHLHMKILDESAEPSASKSILL